MIASLLACAGKRPDGLGLQGGRLRDCPDKPNCVSSTAGDAGPRVAPLHPSRELAALWSALPEALEAMPRTRVETARDDYLHAEASSALFGFVDDVELHLDREAGVVQVRSASRLGYGDFGVNRRRVESLRAALAKRGVAEGG